MKRLVIKNPRLFLCISLAVFCGFIQNARAEILPFKSYTTSEGLAHDRVNRIIRDTRGFLWFCTSEGLSRFDGYEFKNYTQDDGLPHRAVMDFLETRSGEFWIATNDGLVLFNPSGALKREQTDEKPASVPMFRTLRPENLKTPGLTWVVEDLLEDRDGQVWAASSHGLYRLEKDDDWHLRRFDIPGAAEKRIEDFSNLLQDHTGAIWAGTLSGLYRILPDKSGVKTISKNLRVQSLLEDKDMRIWVGTAGSDVASMGLHLFSYAGDEPREIRVFGKRDGLSDDFWMNALLETADGRIFVGVGRGLCEYTPQADEDAPQFRVLSNDGIVALAEDTSGNLWFSTGSSGVKRLARNGFVIYDKSDGLSNERIASIISAPDGETYVLPEADKIYRFTGKGFGTIVPRAMIARSWGTGQITFPDHTGEWWIAGANGLQRYPRVGRLDDLATTKPLKTYTTLEGLYSNDVFRLFEDSRGDVWICNIGDIVNTLVRWERSTESFHGYTTEDGIPPRNGATAFGEDHAGNIWIGFYSGGLVRFHSGKFESFTAENGLPPGYIHNIFTDSKGRVWVATSSGGMLRIDNPTSEEKPRLLNLTTRDGLSSNHATCATEDNFGRIYISTGRGVNRLDLETGRVKVFTKADGLPENIVTQCKRDANGALWFGTSQGLARYVPVAAEQSKPPPIFLSDLRVNGVTIKKLSALGETTIKNLDFASEQRQIQVDFFALGFGTGEALRYQYKLEAIDAEWSAPSEQRTVSLNLSPGEYQFLVRAVNADGIVSENPAALSFTIARPVWLRWWFLILLTLVIAGLIYLIYSYRLKRLLELEKVRTRIATDLHDDIGSSLSQIAILSEIARHKGGANEPLDLIADTSREMVDSMADIIWAINPRRDNLNDLIGRMRNLASEMTEFTDINLRFNLSGVESEDSLQLGADLRREIYLIFKETVNNLVKHADCKRAEIEFRLEADVFSIVVNDDGKGFDITLNGEDSARGRNGLINMRRRAANLGGNYEIESGAGKGTTATLRVPLKSKFRGFGLKKFLSRN